MSIRPLLLLALLLCTGCGREGLLTEADPREPLKRTVALGQALQMEGAGTAAVIPHSSGLALTTLMVEMWVRTAADGNLIAKSGAWHVTIQDGYLVFGDVLGGGAAFNGPGAPRLTDGQWHHVAFSMDAGGNLSLIFDGASMGTLALTPLAQLQSGGDWKILPAHDYVVDELRIWSILRDASDVRASANTELGPTAGLVGYWPFNGTLEDATGRNPLGVLGTFAFVRE